MENGTKQIFVTCRELNDAKVVPINGKISNILGVTNLNKIENWEYIKEKLLWVNVNFNSLEEVKSAGGNFCFPFKTTSLSYLLSFSIYLIDDDNKPIEFVSSENKISILHFKIDVFSKRIENSDRQNLNNK